MPRKCLSGKLVEDKGIVQAALPWRRYCPWGSVTNKWQTMENGFTIHSMSNKNYTREKSRYLGKSTQTCQLVTPLTTRAMEFPGLRRDLLKEPQGRFSLFFSFLVNKTGMLLLYNNPRAQVIYIYFIGRKGKFGCQHFQISWLWPTVCKT